jgi:hypothetical protein
MEQNKILIMEIQLKEYIKIIEIQIKKLRS